MSTKPKKPRRARRGEFLSPYRPPDAYLLKPGRAKGIPGIIEGTSADGNPVLIRVWPRGPNIDDSALVDIWRNELRVLHRLGGAPGAEEYIGRLVDAGQDDRGFYIVIGAGQRRPIATLLDPNRRGTEWRRSVAAPSRRRQLWENLRRIALALEILHSQGLLHCNLDTWSVLTNGTTDLDFQLTGFEWSIRLVGASGNSSQQASGAAVSFLDDWAAFARLCATLLNINLDRLTDIRTSSHQVAEHVSADEVSFLRDLLFPGPLIQLDGEFAARRIDRIATSLEAAASADNAQYYVILGLGSDSDLSRAIRDASDLTIEVDDVDSQMKFIEGDLGAEPRVLATEADNGLRLFLRGDELVYRIRQYHIRGAAAPTWEFAACERAEAAITWRGTVEHSYPVAHSSLSFMTFGDARDRVPRLRGRSLNWERITAELSSKGPNRPTRDERTRRAFTLLHALDLVFASAEVFPVTVVPEAASEDDAEPRMRVHLAEDSERNDLADALGLKSMGSRLADLLERDAVPDDEGWLFTGARALGNRTASDIELQYEEPASSDDEPAFIFRVPSQSIAIPPSEGLLIPGEFRGRIAQFQRRARALKGLREHSELLRMLSDPRGRLVATHEIVESDDFLSRLDDAKQSALEELVAILPLYLLQGPPGVGKTYLVREVVRRRFAEEPAARILLTAQSHHSVDHLASELQKDWKTQGVLHPLAVRCAGPERTKQTDLDLSVQTQRLAKDLADSDIAKTSTPRLLDTLRFVARGASSTSTAMRRTEMRGLEGLIMRSANVVFATTNSGDLERLVDERGQFDWAIVEEAGKATGVELLMPLLLSHRRLMIGDHKQLPPFGADKVDELLNDPEKLRAALRLGLELIERSLRDVVDDELSDLIEDDSSDFGLLCADAKRMLFLFQTLIEDEVIRQGRPGARTPNIARVLNIQHRMHPVIADLVSKCFYDGVLNTSGDAQKKFLISTSPVTTRNQARLPDTPIVVVDMPYQQSTIRSRNVERHPRFTNVGEVGAVKSIVRLLQSTSGTKPSLAVLSPYARQVARIRTELKEDDGCAAALSGFSAVARNDDWCSTVDAFQGNEADAVIVSLVRNNHHATLRSALGFISDPRRMNVLLSRARWRLYIVTSLEFLRTVATPLGLANDPKASFLRELLVGLDTCFNAGTATRVTPDSLLPTP